MQYANVNAEFGPSWYNFDDLQIHWVSRNAPWLPRLASPTSPVSRLLATDGQPCDGTGLARAVRDHAQTRPRKGAFGRPHKASRRRLGCKLTGPALVTGQYSEVFEGVDIANEDQLVVIKVLKPIKKKKVKRCAHVPFRSACAVPLGARRH